MDLFSPHLDSPGPGVAADAPRKKGLPRLWEVTRRDFWSFYLAGWLALLAALPLLAGAAWGILAGNLAVAALGGAVGGALAAPPLCGCMDTVFRSLRDEPCYWWHTYKRVLRANARPAALCGAASGGLLAVQSFALCGLLARGQAALAAAQLAGLGLGAAAALFCCAQLVLVRCPAAQLLKNALLLTFGFLPQALLALGVWLLYALLLTRTPGLTALLLGLGSLWAPVLGSCFALYAPLDRAFRLEERVKELQRARYGG